MKPLTIALLVALIPATMCGCAVREPVAEFDLAAARETIEEKNRAFTKAHVTGEVGIINAYFTDDARIFAPNSDVVAGRAAIDALNEEYVGYGISDFTEQTTAVYGDQDLLVEEGTYSMTYGDDATVEVGKYINIWVPIDGEWKVSANIWNSSMPTAPPESP